METLYIRINVSALNSETDAIRDTGLFFESIADAVSLNRDDIQEIDETNYLSEINNINNKYSK